jgi:hypothetical protein
MCYANHKSKRETEGFGDPILSILRPEGTTDTSREELPNNVWRKNISGIETIHFSVPNPVNRNVCQ